jgi:hypothetical protein
LAIPIDVQLKLVDSLITPIFVYSCEVWGFENKQGIEKAKHYNFLLIRISSELPNVTILFKS